MANSFLDAYNMRARLAPAIIVLLPVLMAAVAWFPAEKMVMGALASTGGTLAISVLLAHVARDLGKKKEASLFYSWGGQPTTRQLSYRTTTLNEHTLQRYHDKLRTLCPNLSFPSSRDDEETAHDRFTQSYESATDFLRAATRDRKKFPLVHEENTNYGFRRNLWAMKANGIGLAILGIVLTAARICHAWWMNGEIDATATVGSAVCVFLIALWMLRVMPSWVHVVAIAYAKELLATCEQLQAAKNKQLQIAENK